MTTNNVQIAQQGSKKKKIEWYLSITVVVYLTPLKLKTQNLSENFFEGPKNQMGVAFTSGEGPPQTQTSKPVWKSPNELEKF